MGSNLNLSGEIECDASIMDGKSLHFGAVGALSGELLHVWWYLLNTHTLLCYMHFSHLDILTVRQESRSYFPDRLFYYLKTAGTINHSSVGSPHFFFFLDEGQPGSVFNTLMLIQSLYSVFFFKAFSKCFFFSFLFFCFCKNSKQQIRCENWHLPCSPKYNRLFFLARSASC